jgi:hypothetical protein
MTLQQFDKVLGPAWREAESQRMGVGPAWLWPVWLDPQDRLLLGPLWAICHVNDSSPSGPAPGTPRRAARPRPSPEREDLAIPETVGMRPADFFTDGESPYLPGLALPRPRLNHQLLRELRSGPLPDVDDTAVAEGLLDLVEGELRAYSTREDQRLTDQQSEAVIRTLEAVTKRLGMPIGLPFRSFGTFRGNWESRGATGSGAWQRRRDLVTEVFEPTRKRLDALKAGLGGPTIDEELIANLRDPAAIKERLDRLQRSAYDDPAPAIGIAKELVESTAKTVLAERGLPVGNKDKLLVLVSKAQRALDLHPSSGHAGPDRTDAVKRILGSLMSITEGLDELRNRGYGTGHGPAGKRVGLRPRHGRLAMNTAVTWCNFMLDTLADPKAPWRAEG